MAQNRLKIVVVGDGMVGKTCLLMTYTKDHFPNSYENVVFENHQERILVDGRSVELHLVDTAGQEDYEKLRPIIYPETNVFLACFSVTSKASFLNIPQKWLPELKDSCPDVPVILIGTKSDLRDQKEVQAGDKIDPKEAVKLAKQLEARGYLECSALSRYNIREVFYEAARVGMDPKYNIPGLYPKIKAKKCGIL